MNIHSKIKPATILHVIHRKEDFMEGRTDLTADETPLQVAAIKQEAGKTFRPHKHIQHKRVINLTNECWVVISGKVKVTYYDLDDTILHEDVLLPGDLTLTIASAGHNYLFMQDGCVLEIKNGPFEGVEKDKTFLD